MDWNEVLVIYLLGCAACLLVLLFNLVLGWLIMHATKENILVKNRKKIEPPDAQKFTSKLFIQAFTCLLESLLSWIGVLFNLGQTMQVIFNLITEKFSTKPEIVKQLRWPLWNNPDLSRESVWAHFTALGIVTGVEVHGEWDYLDYLNNLSHHYPDFDRKSALKNLKSLNVGDQAIIDLALEEI